MRYPREKARIINAAATMSRRGEKIRPLAVRVVTI
jgi:hypothetical protein